MWFINSYRGIPPFILGIEFKGLKERYVAFGVFGGSFYIDYDRNTEEGYIDVVSTFPLLEDVIEKFMEFI